MKNNVAACALLSIAMQICAADSFDVEFKADALGVVFEDTNLSQAERTTIIHDIQRVLSTTPAQASFIRTDDGKPPRRIESGRIEVGSVGHHWPKEYWKNGFGEYRFDQATARRELVVSKDLSDAFQDAIAFKAANQDAIAKLDKFIDNINEGPDPSALSLDEKRALFWFPPGVPEWNEERYYDKNIMGLKDVHFHKPSIMAFKEEELDGARVLYCKSIVSMLDQPVDSAEEMVLVYDGKA